MKSVFPTHTALTGMERKEQCGEFRLPDLGPVLILAEQVHRALAVGARWGLLGRTLVPEWGILPPPAARRLQASTLAAHLGRPENPPVPDGETRPEDLPGAVLALKAEREALAREAAALDHSLEETDRRLALARAQKAETIRRGRNSRSRLTGLEAEHRETEAGRLRRLEEKRKALLLLAEKAKSRSSADARDEDERLLKVRYSLTRAEYELDRARLEQGRIRLARINFENKQHVAAAKLLENRERILSEGFAAATGQRENLVRRLERLVEVAADVEAGAGAWADLKTELLIWPQAGKLLHERAVEAAGFERRQTHSAFTVLDAELAEMTAARQEAAGLLEEAVQAGTHILAEMDEFSRAAADLSLEIDRVLAEIGREQSDPAPSLQDFTRRLEDLRSQEPGLRDRRKRAAEQIEKRLEICQDIDKQYRLLAARRKDLLSRSVAAVRSRATRRKVLCQRADRLERDLGRLFDSLRPLLGPSRFLEHLFLTMALRLDSARRELKVIKQALAQAHDRLQTAASAGFSALDSRPADRLLQRFEQHLLAAPDLARLDRQIAALSGAAEKHDRIIAQAKDLSARQAELDRVTAEKSRLEKAAAQREAEAERLTQEVERLRSSEAEARQGLEELSAEKDLLLREADAQRAQQALLAEERKKLEQALAQREAALFGLAADKDSISKLAEERRQDMVRLGRERDQFLQELERVREAADRAEESRQSLDDRITGLAAHQDELRGQLVFARAELAQASGGRDRLIMEAKRLRVQRDRLHEERNRLAHNLERSRKTVKYLAAHLKREVYPLVNVLGQALYQAQARASRLGEAEVSLKEQLAALTAAANELAADRAKVRSVNAKLTRAWTVLEKKTAGQEKRRQVEQTRLRERGHALTDRIGNLEKTLVAARSEKEEALVLVGRQAREIGRRDELLAEIYPLLEFFLENLRPQPPAAVKSEEPALPESAQPWILMLHLLREENDHLRQAVGDLETNRRALNFENEHLKLSHRAVKQRLEELLPLLQYLWRSWLETASALAAGQDQKRLVQARAEELEAKLAGREADWARLSEDAARTARELSQTKENLIRTEEGRRQAAGLAARLEKLLAEAQERLTRLEADFQQSEAEAAGQALRLESLSRGHEELGRRNLDLEKKLRASESELDTLRVRASELGTRLQDETGRAEASLAALAHVSSNARDVIEGLEREAAGRAEEVRDLGRRLEDESLRVAQLEQAQDRLGLLFWILAKYGGDNGDSLEALIELTRQQGLMDAAGIAGARLQEMAQSAASCLGSESFRKNARRAVRRGLYSLLLAGSLILARPEESSKATAPSEDQARAQRLARLTAEKTEAALELHLGPVYCPEVKRPFDLSFLTPWEKARGFEYMQNRIIRELETQARRTGLDLDDYLVLLQRRHPEGTPIDLEDLAGSTASLSLINGEFPRIAADFRDKAPSSRHCAALHRLARRTDAGECRFWDSLYADYRALGADSHQALAMILNNIQARFRTPNETPPEFGGRLKPIPELERMNLARFTSLVAPYIKANIEVFTAHDAFSYAHEPDEIDGYARRLARDIHVAARSFGVPLTLMVSIAHQESYFANVLGDNTMSASPFQIYRPTKPFIIKGMIDKGLKVPGVPNRLQDHVTLATYMAAFHLSDLMEKASVKWGKNKALLCDLDRVALLYNGGPAYPSAVYRKKVRLLGYIDRLKSASTATDSPIGPTAPVEVKTAKKTTR